jgi:hypothetical protein
MRRRIKGPAQWFLVSGCVGILVAIALYTLGSIAYSRHFVVLVSPVLCPEMILGLAEPTNPAAIAHLLAIVFGTNFILYGNAGLVLWVAWTSIRRATSHRA